jgi:HEPN domain-containing protein
LLDLLNDADFTNYRSFALILNSYAVETRYPGEYCEPEHADAEEALRMATEMYELAKKKLGL